MVEKFKELILKGEFLKAKSIMECITKEQLEKALFEIGCDEGSICAYSFICFLLLENESVEYHCMASELLSIAFPHIYGGYQSALYHIRRAIELDPNDKELKRELLLFNDIPEKLVSDEEARQILADDEEARQIRNQLGL
ncbi:hypothetical protein [Acetivibrio clariflavus]|uniref:hypothetical protein n=1 Tax=Acetivibrio clariflavus TaxID=288965 RepID=UPI0004822D62|nr:hypothetical protein [Acetivibrio clariflavus]